MVQTYPTQQEALAEAYKRNLLTPQMKEAYESALSRGLFEEKKTPEPSISSKIAQGFGQGILDAGQGVKQLALETGEKIGLVNPGSADEYTREVQNQRLDYDESPYGQSKISKASRLVGSAAPLTAAGLAAAPAFGTGLLGATVLGAGLGGASGLLSFVPEGESRKSNAMVGAGLGASFPVVGRAITGLGGAVVNKLGEKIGPTKAQAVVSGAAGAGIGAGLDAYNEGDTNYMLGLGAAGTAAPVVAKGLSTAAGKIFNTAKGNLKTPEMNEVVELGEKFGIPVMASDLARKPGIVGSLARLSEDSPVFSSVPARLNQMAAASTAADKYTQKLQNDMVAAQYGGKTGLKKLQEVAAGTGPRAQQAQHVLDEIDNAGDDWNLIIKTSGDVSLLRRKLIADAKYNKVEQLAGQYGAVPTTNTLNAIDGAIQQNMGITAGGKSALPDDSLIKSLQKLRENIASGNLDYGQMRKVRSEVSTIIEDYYKGGNALVGNKGVGPIQGVKKAIERDMDEFAKNNGPELKTAWRNADRFQREYVVPYKDVQLAKALSNSDPDEIYGRFIKTGTVEGDKGTGRATRFYNALDEKGRAAVMYGMAKSAFEKSVNRDAQSFSPAQWAGEMERIASSTGVFFKGAQKQELEGLRRLMRHVEKAGQMNKPETGVRTIPYIITLLGMGGAGYAGYTGDVSGALTYAGEAALGAYGLKKLMTTPAGRTLLLSSSKLPPMSPQMERHAQKIINFLQKGTTVAIPQQISQAERDRR
jgi:hypothetical protein